MSEPWSSDDGEKVVFRLHPDADGYPPADWEHLWAEEMPNGLFRLENTPFFARGVSFGDVVAADEQDDMNVFREVVIPSGHSTLRLVFFDEDAIPRVRARLEQLGCSSELSHVPNLVAVDVPPEVSIAVVRSYLAEGEAAGTWEYEVGAVRQ